MFIHQSEYVEQILEKFKMVDAKAVSIPADPHAVLSPVETEGKIDNLSPYREAVRSLMFLTVVSRPDLAFAVNTVAKFLNKHNLAHWKAVKRIFAYLIGKKNLGITYRSGGKNSELVSYCDSDYAGDIETRRSTTGYAFTYANGLVTWSSQRQKIVTLSTTKSEYVAAAAAAREIIWLRKLICDLRSGEDETTVLYIDNQSTIKLTKNLEFHKRSKRIEIRYHYIREKVQKIAVKYISTKQQKADIFTKALSKERFNFLCDILGLLKLTEYSYSESVE